VYLTYYDIFKMTAAQTSWFGEQKCKRRVVKLDVVEFFTKMY